MEYESKWSISHRNHCGTITIKYNALPSHMYNMEISYNLFILAALAGLALSTPVHDNYHGYNRYSGYGSHSRRCSSPKHLYHGGYNGTDNYYSIGHKVTYYCDDGYELYGSGYLTCRYSSRYNRGYWDNYTPYCRCKIIK